MTRPVGVTLIAVLLFLLSTLMLVTALRTLSSDFAPAQAMPDSSTPESQSMRAGLVRSVFIGSAVSVWGIVNGVGLFQLKNWARISTIVLAAFFVVKGGFVFFAFAYTAHSLTTADWPEFFLILGKFLLYMILLVAFGMWSMGIWCMVYLTRPKVKRCFVREPPILVEAAALPPANSIS